MCVLLAGGASITIHEGGAELFDAIGTQFSTSPVRSPRTAEAPRSDMYGLPIEDELDAIARDTRDASKTPALPHDGWERA